MHASPMRKAEGRHNQRLSTSWRNVIFHSPRGIACFNGGRQSGSELSDRISRDSTSATISRCLRPDARRGSIPGTGFSCCG